jgi:hypothetical protein
MLQEKEQKTSAQLSQKIFEEGFQRRPEWQERRLTIRKVLLPAVPAVSAISAAAASTAVTACTAPTAATAMPAASTAVTAASASGAASAATLSLRPRFIHYQVPPAEILPVQRVDRTVSIFVALHFDERKAAWLSREPVTD